MHTRKCAPRPPSLQDGNIEEELQKPGPLRMWAIAHAFQQGFTVETVHALTRIDRWFLGKLFSVHQARKRMESLGSLEKLTEAGPEFLRRMKQLGFCDRQIGKAIKDSDLAVMQLRAGWHIRRVGGALISKQNGGGFCNINQALLHFARFHGYPKHLAD